MNILLHTLFFLIITTVSNSYGRETHKAEGIGSEADYALKESLEDGDFEKFSNALKRGGDPTIWFENSSVGWVLCAATRTGQEEYLEFLISRNVDLDFRQSKISSELSTAILCAIHHNNLLSVQLLVKAGADTTIEECVTCKTSIHTSAVWSAALSSYYDIAVWLIQNGDYSAHQFEAIVNLLETINMSSDFPQNSYRLELAEILKTKGYDVNLSDY